MAEAPGTPLTARSASGAKSAHQINDKANHQDQAKSSAAVGGAAEIKPAPTEQKKKNNDKEQWIHARTLTCKRDSLYGAFTSNAFPEPGPAGRTHGRDSDFSRSSVSIRVIVTKKSGTR